MPGSRLKIIEAVRLRLAPSASAELAAAALVAQADAGIPAQSADFIVIAVPAGAAIDVAEDLLTLADRLVGDWRPDAPGRRVPRDNSSAPATATTARGHGPGEQTP